MEKRIKELFKGSVVTREDMEALKEILLELYRLAGKGGGKKARS